ncbi:MAG: hypothetical protein AAFR18_21745 [Cyanobacteria bacterium J06627_32]
MVSQLKERDSQTTVPRGIWAIIHWFRQQSQALPAKTWTTWWQTIALGMGISALIVYGMTRSLLPPNIGQFALVWISWGM